MLLDRVRVVAVVLVVSSITGHGDQRSPSNRPWPPGVQQVPDASPPLAPEDALKTFYMPPGYRLELVASEPLVQDPVAIDWDLERRLWVVEMPGYMRTVSGEGEREPTGRIVVLQDTDNDGRMDRRTVFADGLILARAIKVLDRGVLVGEPPNVWLMRDTNGDLRMDEKQLVTSQYGRLEVDPENNANSFDWALDNRMYTAGQSTVQLRLKNGAFEVTSTLSRGQWGVTHDDAGRTYRNTNESALHIDLVPTTYFARNPNLLRTRGSYERLADANPDLNTVWPVRPTPGTNRAYQAGITRADGSLARFTAVCAPLVYRGDRLPAELYGNVFVAEPAGNLVSRIIIDEDATGLRARKAYEGGEFLASTDERFRPVYLSNGPDGTLYVVDMYRGIIEHRVSLTVYLRDQIIKRHLEQPTGLGRIYRVVHHTTLRDTTSLANASPADLVEMLTHPSGWRRDTAQRLLVERKARVVVPALERMTRSAEDPRTRLHALWTLDGLDAIEWPIVARALEDHSAHVRAAAIRIAERWLDGPDHRLRAAVLKRLDDPDRAVRLQLAATLGTLPPDRLRAAAVLSLLERHGDDPVTLDIVLSGLRGREATVLDALMRIGEAQTTQREAAITMLAATIVRGAQDDSVQEVFARIAVESGLRWQRSAVLHGAEIALLGAVMPGTPRQRATPAGAAPCPTCPGARGGPGGAYVFPPPEPAPNRHAAARARGAGLRLNREPAALSALAVRHDDLGARAARILARVTWPGKPGGAAPVPPLTAEEQKRFDAGHEIYRNMCQACHQADGRGQDKIAPSLIGAVLTLGPADIPARVLLNGKEGAVGLMPPIGAALDDEQIASVLTYVRRAWGHAGTPVDPATVKAVRARTATRTRPWTDAELTALAEADSRERW